MAEMAYVFAEEFARMGFDARRILGLFAILSMPEPTKSTGRWVKRP